MIAALAAVGAVAAGLAAAVSPGPAEAAVTIVPRRAAQFGDGEVRATAQIGNRIYVAGSYRRVGPLRTGSAGVADPFTGSFAATPFPAIDGPVNAVVADGSGGWYVGGDFDTVGGLWRQNLAHVLADGTVTAFKAKTDGPVHALALDPTGNALYAGGSFTRVASTLAANLVAVHRSTGALLPWAGTTDGAVRALVLAGDRLVVGGAFTTAGGAARSRLALLDRATGAADAGFVPSTTDGEVRTVVRAADGTLFAGGTFTWLGGQRRNRLGAVGPTGAATTFNPNVEGTVHTLALAPNGSVLWLGGSFGKVSGSTRKNLAGINLPSGSVASTSFDLQAGPVDSLLATPDGNTLYVGGTWDWRSEDPPNPVRIAALDLFTGTWRTGFSPALFEPAVGRVGVRALALAETGLFIGGDFGAYDGVERPFLVAIDATTGLLDPTFAPAPNKPVYALIPSPDGTSLYVGGLFTRIGGRWLNRLAKLNPATGAADPAFTTGADAEVMKLATDGSTLYVAGRFRTVGGSPRRSLAAVDGATGALRPLNLPADGAIRAIDLSPDGSRLFATGQFTTLGGVRRWGLAQIDTTTGALTPWAPALYAPLRWTRDLEVSSDGNAVYVVSSGGDSPPAGDTAVRFPTAGTGNVAPTWVNRVKDTMEAVAVADDAIYIGGHLRWVDNGALTRSRIAALDPATGQGLPWNPTANGFRGVLDLTLGESGLLVGSDGTHVGKAPSARFGLLPTVPPVTP